jgi:3',5'-cyclic AMP phosphodiesterase CpdA
MSVDCRFAVMSDLHVALPETIFPKPYRLHAVELSVLACEAMLAELRELELDFLLLTGDLTQDGEFVNHDWLQAQLSALPFPTYVIPGNHDVPTVASTSSTLGLQDFPRYYSNFGYDNSDLPYYCREVHPGVRLIGLNSNTFDADGNQCGRMDEDQLDWLRSTLAEPFGGISIAAIHHNAIDHFPGQSTHIIGSRYTLDNAPILREILAAANVRMLFTGHLHVQDVARNGNLYEITTGSTIGYPHPYRLCHYHSDANEAWLQIDTNRLKSLPHIEDLSTYSRNWIADRSERYLLKLLIENPVNLSPPEASELLPQLKYFWADIAAGDNVFNFPNLPPSVRQYCESFGAISEGNPHRIDNHTKLTL